MLLREGTSSEYGVRELKRTIHRHLAQPLATLIARNQIRAGARVLAKPSPTGEGLTIRPVERTPQQASVQPSVLLVDDNPALLQFLGLAMTDAGWQFLSAGSAAEARQIAEHNTPRVIMIDYLLPDGYAVELGHEFAQKIPGVCIAVMTSTSLSPEEETVCEADNFLVLGKPFLPLAAISQIRDRLVSAADLAGAAHVSESGSA
jgi:CheY-like chemotaxis protein